jgi:transcriptional repressor NrdR
MGAVNCPECNGATRVLESRRGDAGASVRRRRSCTECETRFTTFERIELERLYVSKRDGRRQPFDPEKLRRALVRAAHKRDVSSRDVDALVAEAEAEARAAGGTLPTERIVDLCLRRLHDLDPGAYLQFAGTLPSASADFAGFEAAAAGVVPSGAAGSMASPHKSVSKER